MNCSVVSRVHGVFASFDFIIADLQNAATLSIWQMTVSALAANHLRASNSSAWFRAGVEAALLAPTAMNQQKFTLTRNGGKVSAKAGLVFYAKTDLGIVKYHFEQGAGKDSFVWSAD